MLEPNEDEPFEIEISEEFLQAEAEANARFEERLQASFLRDLEDLQFADID